MFAAKITKTANESKDFALAVRCESRYQSAAFEFLAPPALSNQMTGAFSPHFPRMICSLSRLLTPHDRDQEGAHLAETSLCCF